MDALSEALNAVHVRGAVFFDAECRAPWGFAVPELSRVAHFLAPGAERIVNFHFVTEGAASVRFADGLHATVGAGDIVIIPHGHAHAVSNGGPAVLIDSAALVRDLQAGAVGAMRLDGPGEVTRFVCGFLSCERRADGLFLAGLPRMMTINVRGDPCGQWIESSLRHLATEAASSRPGRSALLAKMAEALFIEALRRHMEQLPAEESGWLAAARDPIAGAALVLMHREPGYAWTVAELARRTSTSRSVLLERFARLLGEPPLSYLTRWRLQLAARLLQTTQKSMIQVAGDVGYTSQAAFNRAFKRAFGLPPAKYRRFDKPKSQTRRPPQ